MSTVAASRAPELTERSEIDARRRQLLRLAPFGLAGLALAGCTTAPRRTVPVTLSIEFVVSSDVNPDVNGRPSPVVLTLYKLSKFEAFRSLDYFSLSSAEAHAEFRLEESFTVQPMTQSIRRYTLEPDDAGFGVVAAFRDIANSQWRASAELPPLKVSRIKLPEVLTRADPVMAYRADVLRSSLGLTRVERG